MNRKSQQLSDAELEEALGHFRQSMRAWSETAYALRSDRMHAAESGNPKQSSRKLCDWLTWSIGFSAAGATVAACALAAALFTTGHKAAPMPSPHELAQTAVPASRKSATTATSQHPRLRVERPAEQHAPQQTKVAPAVGPTRAADDPDAKLLAAIDTDISQGTPTALAPMANWMGDSADQ